MTRTKQVIATLITPTQIPDDSHELRQVQTFLTLLLVAFIVATTIAIIRYFAHDPYLPTYVSPFLILAWYFISRQRYARANILGGILIASLLNPVIIFVYPSAMNPLATSTSAVVAILFADIVMNKRYLGGVVLLNLSLVIVVIALLPDSTLADRMPWLVPVIFVGAFTLIRQYVSPQLTGQSSADTEATLITDNVNDDLLLLREAFAHGSEALFIADVDEENTFRICHVNAAYTRMMLRDADAVIGQVPVLLRELTQHRPADELYTSLASGKIQKGETTVPRADDNRLTVQWTLQPIMVAEKFKYLLGLQQDVTLQRSIELDLSAKQERYEMMSDLMSDYAYAFEVNADGTLRLQWVTGSYMNVFGRAYDELITYPGWESLVHLDERTLYARHIKALMEGESCSVEYRIVRPDGMTRWVSDNSRPLKDEHGQVIAIYGAAHDVTERVYADEALRLDAFQKAVVAELGLLALKTDDQDDMLEQVLALSRFVLGMTFSMIVTHQDDKLAVLATSTDGEPYFTVGTHFPIDGNKSLAGFALTCRELIVSSTFKSEEKFIPRPVIQESDVESGIGVVIQGTSATPFGVLVMYGPNQYTMSDSDVVFMKSVANIVGTFMERLRARQAEKAEREFNEGLREATIAINAQRDLDTVLTQILETLARLIPNQNTSAIILWDEAIQAYRFVSVRGHTPENETKIKTYRLTLETSPILKRMLDDNGAVLGDARDHPELFTTEQGKIIRGYVGAPIQVGGGNIGFISVTSYTPHVYTKRDVETVRAFAEKIGNAILNARHAENLQQIVEDRTAELQREREQLQTILDATGEGVFYTEDGVMRYANRTMAAMTGYDLEDFIGMYTNILHPLDIEDEEVAILRSSRDAISQGETWREVVRLKRKDDTVFPAGLTISRVGHSVDGVYRAVTIVRDISKEQEIEQFRNRFIADAAHELRSPIANLNTTMYLLKKQPEKQEKHLERLQKVIKRMNHLVRDLLDTFSIEQGRIKLKKEVIILQDVIHNVVDLQTPEANQQSIILRNELSDEPIQLLADANRLEQVFTNLIHNALNHTLEGGTISIRSTGFTDDNQVVILVEDTGSGIREDDLKHLFQPFYRVDGQKPETGTGLGLSIAHDIVTLHEGLIHIESEVGIGTKVFVTLPLLED